MRDDGDDEHDGAALVWCLGNQWLEKMMNLDGFTGYTASCHLGRKIIPGCCEMGRCHVHGPQVDRIVVLGSGMILYKGDGKHGTSEMLT